MLTEPRTYATLGARCPGCGGVYAAESLPFLYADELGVRCSGCGGVLIVGIDRGPWGRAPNSYLLVLPKGLEGSELHEKLAEMAERGEGLRVVVGRAGEPRPVRLVSAVLGDPAAENETR